MVWQTAELTGEQVALEPLTSEHYGPLWAIAQHADIWRYMPFLVRTEQEFRAYLMHLAELERSEQAMPFATRERRSGALVGATSFLAISEVHKRLEIGATWITPARQRSAVNTEAKLLQLEYAFETLGCNRVEFKTDALNQRSRNALLRIGAVEEGLFRQHMVLPDGRLRDSAWFAIVRDDWPNVRSKLKAKLSQR